MTKYEKLGYFTGCVDSKKAQRVIAMIKEEPKHGKGE
nr:MAG TPA: hypothetical protein [Crassvirales sp.]